MSSTEVKKHVIKTFPELKGIVTVKMQEDNSCILQVEYKETKLPEIKDQGIFTVKLGKEYVISNEGVEEAVIAWNRNFLSMSDVITITLIIIDHVFDSIFTNLIPNRCCVLISYQF